MMWPFRESSSRDNYPDDKPITQEPMKQETPRIMRTAEWVDGCVKLRWVQESQHIEISLVNEQKVSMNARMHIKSAKALILALETAVREAE